MEALEKTIRGWQLAASLLLVPPLAACTSQDAYRTGQSWQTNECNKIYDTQERNRCLASASMSYEEYQRQQAALRAGK